jgi:hypothetical protein
MKFVSVVLFGLLCFTVFFQVTTVVAQTPNAQALPPEVAELLAKDPATLSPEEVARVRRVLMPGGVGGTGSVMAPENAAQCFDYYTFGSVQVFLTPSVKTAVSGSAITFSGTIVNENPYPIINGQVYVKVFSTTNPSGVNGYPVVDQFFAADNITIAANSSTSVSFTWKVPAYSESGDYEVSTFFMTEKRFNLLGLPFTDDVTGNKVNFSIAGEMEGGVAFNKEAVRVNNQSYRFAAFPPRVTSNDPVIIEAVVENTTTATVTIPVTFTLYNWAGERQENQLDTETTNVTLLAGEKKIVTYEASEAAGAVSYVRAHLSHYDMQSILNIRFVRDGKEDIRLNFPGITAYPLMAATSTTIFSCLHSTNVPFVDGAKLELLLTDTAGAVIHQYVYEGGVTGSMMAIKDAVTPDTTITEFDLIARLYQKDILVEEVTIPYRCALIDESLCEPPAVTKTGSDNSFMRILLSLAVGVFVLLLYALYKRFMMPSADDVTDRSRSTPLCFVFMLILPGVALWLIAPASVAAKSVTVTAGGVPALAAWANFAPAYTTDTVSLLTDINDIPSGYTLPDGTVYGGFDSWAPGLQPGASTQVTYKVSLVNNATNQPILDGANVPIGTVLRIEELPALDTDISWVGTGLSYDSPYGHWVDGAGPSSAACRPEDFVNQISGQLPGRPIDIYVLFNVHRPQPTVTASSNLSCTGALCTVTAAGPITLSMNFPQTYGRFYYRYFDYHTVDNWAGGSGSWYGCHANNAPMRASTLTWYPPDPSLGPIWGIGAWGVSNVAAVPYSHTIPAAAVSFTATAAAPAGNPPAVPTVTAGSGNSNLITVAQTFIINGTDPDGDTVRYGIDWNVDNTVDEWLPGSGYVTSGTNLTASRTWITTGVKTFQVLTEDSSGLSSGYVTGAITITNPPVTSALTTAGCTIPRGGNQCNGQVVTWNVTNGLAPYALRNVTTNLVLSSNPAGTNMIIPLQYGNTTITMAHDNGVVLQSRSVQASCNTAVDEWDGAACVEKIVTPTPTISITVTPTVIRSGQTATVNWNITNMTGYSCVINGIGFNGTALTTAAGSIESVPIKNKSAFQVSCTNGVDTVTQDAVVEVVPVSQEV